MSYLWVGLFPRQESLVCMKRKKEVELEISAPGCQCHVTITSYLLTSYLEGLHPCSASQNKSFWGQNLLLSVFLQQQETKTKTVSVYDIRKCGSYPVTVRG